MRKILVGIFTVICMLLAQTCAKAIFKAKTQEQQREWKNSIDESYDEEVIRKLETTSDIDKKLEILVKEMNKQLPQRMDDITVLDRMEFRKGRELCYCYTIFDDSLKLTKREMKNFQEEMIQRVKQSDGLNKFKENQVTMSYVYYNSCGDCIMTIKVFPEDYQ